MVVKGLAWQAMAAGAAALCCAGSAWADGEVKLEPGRRAERRIAAGEAHVYAMPPSGRARRLVVEQLGIDLVAVPHGPDGTPRSELNGPLGRFDREVFRLEPDEATVALWPLPGGVASGDYAVTVELLDEPAGTGDPRRSAETGMTRAAEFRLRGTHEEMTRAAELYEAAAADFAALDDRRQQARALLSAANFRRVLRDTGPAHELYRQALGHWRELGDSGFVTDSLVGLGQTGRDLGRIDEARTSLESAARLFNDLGRAPERANVLTSLGLLAQTRGDSWRALGHYQEALEEQQRGGQRREIAVLLLNIGSVHARLGNAADALEHERRALELFRELGDRHRERNALNNLAVLHRRMGEPEAALQLYSQVLRLAAELGDRNAEARALSNRGVTYLVLGDLDRATADLERALGLRRGDEERAGQMLTLANLGDAYYNRGDLETSRRYIEAALDLARRLEHHSQASILADLGRLLARIGDPMARSRFDQARKLLAGHDDPAAEAAVLYRQGEGLLFAGDPKGSQAALAAALTRSRQIGNEVLEVQVLIALGRAARAVGALAVASDHLSQALDLIESRRAEIANPDLRASFLASRHDAYALSVEVLMERHTAEPDAGYDRSALELSERGRARRLLDLLAEAEVELEDAVAPELAGRRRILLRRLSLLAQRRQLVALGRQKSIPDEDLDAAIDDVRAELDLIEGEIRRRDPRRATLASPTPLTADDMRRLLDSETALLHYSLGESRSYLWTVTAEQVVAYELPPRDQIESLARRLHEAWSTLGPTSPEAEDETAAALADRILGATIGQLRKRRLAVVTDGALHYVPFAALPIPDDRGAGATGPRRMVDRFEIVHLPSAAVLAARHSGPSPRSGPATVAVIADPVFDFTDPRLGTQAKARRGDAATTREPGHADDSPLDTASVPPALIRAGTASAPQPSRGFTRLPGTRLEARAIADQLTSRRCRLAVGFDASRDALSDLADYSIVHFATHAVVDTEHPELSGLVLSRFDRDGRRRSDGILRLHDVYRLDLDAELVVLSGCRTALGRELRGEGLQGLTGGFFYAGARRVAASLWSVADQATAELMRRFYRAHLSEGLPAAAALRRAQLELAADRRFRDPYYWAPFVLLGDWR